MFVHFSRTLPLRVPLFAAIGHYFASRHVKQTLRATGPSPLSLHSFFHKSGQMFLLNAYARMLLGLHDTECAPLLRELKARWVYTLAAVPKVRVTTKSQADSEVRGLRAIVRCSPI